MTSAINRYYDSSTGQFTSVDPMVFVTGQAYSYVGGNPVNETDPLGLFCWHFSLHCVLSNISGAASAVSAVTALVPGLEFVSEGAALVAFTADVTNCATGACDWTAVGFDALSLVPGAAALRFAGQAERDAGELVALEALGKVDKSLESDLGFQKLLAKFAGLTGAKLSGITTVLNIVQSSPCGPQ